MKKLVWWTKAKKLENSSQNGNTSFEIYIVALIKKSFIY